MALTWGEQKSQDYKCAAGQEISRLWAGDPPGETGTDVGGCTENVIDSWEQNTRTFRENSHSPIGIK